MLCAVQLVAFLEKLGEYRAPQPMNKKVTQLMATMYGLYDKKNSEIRSAGVVPGAWLVLYKMFLEAHSCSPRHYFHAVHAHLVCC